ncbi:DUF4296 domain-containing protein [Aquimarina sp. W85]|uniref:DUF4296 domain-containing protein n=1 Tax=Aquimarina rhodophyticola TaxID=3342246 RepID=UPI0036724882
MGIKGIFIGLIVVVIFVGIIGCDSVETIDKPSVILNEDQMVKILTDIAFIKAAKSSHRSILNEHNIDPEGFIFKKYQIDSVIFAQNNAWYLSKIKVYKDIFSRVRANIDSSRSKYEILKKSEDSIQKLTDSIQELKRNDSLQRLEKNLKGSLSKKLQKKNKTNPSRKP